MAVGDPSLRPHIDGQVRAFGASQSWVTAQTPRGLAGERLICDVLSAAVNSIRSGSVLFAGIDLGAPGKPLEFGHGDRDYPVVGYGGDLDIVLFVRRPADASNGEYDGIDVEIEQDHIVVVDAKQYSSEHTQWSSSKEAAAKMRWLRRTLGHPRLLGGGNDFNSLRMSYHYVHTGLWQPPKWIEYVDSGSRQEILPGHPWWNASEDLVMESSVALLTGQLIQLIALSHHDYRGWVPEALWQLLPPGSRRPLQDRAARS